MNTSHECTAQQHDDTDGVDATRTAFSDFMDQPQFKDFHEVSNLLRLMDFLDNSPRPQYKTYIAGDTTS